MPLEHQEEVLTTKRLVAAGPLDAKIVIDTLANRDLIPDIERYQGMVVFVEATQISYSLKTPDLSNTGWGKAYSSGTGYLGAFDPNTSPSGLVKDNNDVIFDEGDYAIVAESTLVGFPYNFTTGDLSPDAGGQHIEDLVQGQEIIYNSSSIWDVTSSSNLVTSVNSEIGAVVLDAEDILIDPISGMTATETQEALVELKTITDGLSLGSIYLGIFDPANPPAPPFQPQDGNTNYNSGNFFIVGVDGHWNFTTGDQTNNAGADNEYDLAVGDQIRFNIDTNWDVIPSQATPPGAPDTSIQFNSGGVFGGSADFTWFNSTKTVVIKGTGGAGLLIQEGVSNRAILYNIGGGTLELYKASDDSRSVYLQAGISASYINTGFAFGIGTATPNLELVLDVQGVSAISIPKGTTLQRPATPVASLFRFNTDEVKFEGYDGVEWGALGGSPAGADTEIQFNNLGEFGASPLFFFNSLSNQLTISSIVGAFAGASLNISPSIVASSFALNTRFSLNTFDSVDSGELWLGSLATVPVKIRSLGDSFLNGGGLAIGAEVVSAEVKLDIVATNSMTIPKGTTAQRPVVGISSMLRFNTTDVAFEGYNGIEWGALGGGSSFEQQVIAHSIEGVLDIDFSLGSFAIVTLTANVTSLTISGDDGKGQILFIQDSIGGRSVVFAGNETVDGTIPDYTLNSNGKSLIDVVKASGSVYMFGAGNLIANA
jgi:hypothetical protein